MRQAVAATLLIASSTPALAAIDPCMYDAEQVGELARHRDHGVSMSELIRQAPADQFAAASEYEGYLRKMALVYGNPELSAKVLEDAIYDACEKK